MMWHVQRTENFDKWWKKEKVDDSNFKDYERALGEFQNIPLPHERQACIFKNTSFECWVTRLPDKDRQRGKRSGFRVVLVLDLEEKTLFLQGIFRRNNLSYKGSGGKHDNSYNNLIKTLAQEFVEPK